MNQSSPVHECLMVLQHQHEENLKMLRNRYTRDEKLYQLFMNVEILENSKLDFSDSIDQVVLVYLARKAHHIDMLIEDMSHKCLPHEKADCEVNIKKTIKSISKSVEYFMTKEQERLDSITQTFSKWLKNHESALIDACAYIVEDSNGERLRIESEIRQFHKRLEEERIEEVQRMIREFDRIISGALRSETGASLDHEQVKSNALQDRLVRSGEDGFETHNISLESALDDACEHSRKLFLDHSADLLKTQSLKFELECLKSSDVESRITVLKAKLNNLRREKAHLVRTLADYRSSHDKSLLGLRNAILKLQRRYTQLLRKSFETQGCNQCMYQRIRTATISEIKEMIKRIFDTFANIRTNLLENEGSAQDLIECRSETCGSNYADLQVVFANELAQIRSLPISDIQVSLETYLRDLEKFQELSSLRKNLREENRLLKTQLQ